MGFDLVIRGGTVASSLGTTSADVGIVGEQIAAVGNGLDAGATEIDATGLLVLPGGVDAHVHLTRSERPGRPPTWLDGFAEGSRAAAVGGITTIGNMSSPRPGESLRGVLERQGDEAARESIVDFVLHPVLFSADAFHLAELADLAADGYTSLKFFMLFPEFDANVGGFLAAMSIAAEQGLVTMIHCEDGPITAHAGDRLVAAGRGSMDHYPASRPVLAEAVAVARAGAMAATTGARTYLVHLSGRAALAQVRTARAAGATLYAETRPMYLHHTEAVFAGPDGPLFVASPPVRSTADQNALWEALRDGEIDTCCSDHVAWPRADKLDPARTVRSTIPGVPELETLMPLLFSEGVRRGRLSLQRFVEVTSTNASKIFGIYPQKGAIEVGSDADLAIWDPQENRVVRAIEGQSRADFSPYEGWSVTGWPRWTVRRGRVIQSWGRVADDPGQGRRVRRASGSPP